MNETNLSGKTAVVLGASSPCGRAASKLLASRGANLALGGRNREELESLQEEISASGGRALIVGTHLAKRHHPIHLVEAALEEYGSLDILLFMAHASAPPLDSLNLGAWERSIDVNVKGFTYCLAASLPALRESERGCVAVLTIEKAAATSDPFLRAGQAAVHTILDDIGSFSEEVRAAEILAGTRDLDNPEQCAEKVVRVLGSLPESEPGLSTNRI